MKYFYLLILSFIIKSASAQYDSIAIKQNFEHLKAIKDSFIMKPLRTLLDSCSVPIMSAFGDPEIANMPDLEGARTATFVFFFISRNEIRNQRDGWNQNRHLLISVVDPQGRYGRYPQLPESKEWNSTLAKNYENMIVLRISFMDSVKKNPD